MQRESGRNPNLVSPTSSLSINRLRLLVSLGCSVEERKVLQYVSFDVQIRFSTLPSGCVTDSLEQTVCYAKLCQKIKDVCDLQEYQLIEKLGWDVYQAVREFLPQDTFLWLRATKEHPPVAHLEGGSAFSIGDWVT
jgi:dihydroneopterin aldolase